MGIKTVPQPPYSPDLAPCDFWLFPRLRDCRYETIEEMKEAVTKVIDTLTQEDSHGVFQKLLERYNKCIAARGDYFEGDNSFISVQSVKLRILKKSGILFYAPCIYIYIYIYIYIFIHRPTFSLYHNSSMLLDTRDVSSWDRNPADFTSDGYLIVILCVSEGMFYVYIFPYMIPATRVHNSWEEL